MLAGGYSSSTLVSPTHRLKSESSAQFQACHFPSMSTHILDLPCNFARKDTPRTQSIRPPVGLTVEKLTEAKTTAFLQCKRESKDEFLEEKKGLKKRFSEHIAFDDDDETCMYRANKKKRELDWKSDDSVEEEMMLIKNFWIQQPGFNGSLSGPVPFLTGYDHTQSPFSHSCSEEEEQQQVFYVPSEVIRPFSNNPWVNSFVTEIMEFDEKDVKISQCLVNKASSGSSDSSESHVRAPQDQEKRNGGGSSSRPPTNVTQVLDLARHNEYDHDGFELINLLVSCVEAIGSKNISNINQIIARLGVLASPKGSSPMSRLIAYYTEALALRVANLWPQIFHISPPRDLDLVDNDRSNTLRLLNQVTPVPRFIHFTSNEIIWRSFKDQERVHIIDFDIKQGLQWPSLFQSLASMSKPPNHVRITGIGDSKQELIETGERLAGFARALNLPFEFHPVVDRLEDVRVWMLHVKENETVIVNCVFQLHKLLYDHTTEALKKFLELIRSTNPITVVISEQEGDHNEENLETRLVNSLKYYSAIFDSLDESVPQDDIRLKIEEMYGSEIKNIIACEGVDRVERHQGFGKWRRMMEEQGGFRGVEIGENEAIQTQMLLKMYDCNKNYKVEKLDSCALTLSWSDQPLYTVTAWEAINIHGSSSTFTRGF